MTLSREELQKLAEAQGIPPFATKERMAAFLSEHLFEVRPRTLSRWPGVNKKFVSGKSLLERDSTVAIAVAKLTAAPSAGVMPARATKNQ